MICPKCGRETGYSTAGRSTQCPFCGTYLHTCRMCRHYSPGSYHDCTERVEDPVREKDEPNFCDYFQITLKKVEEKKKRDIHELDSLFSF